MDYNICVGQTSGCDANNPKPTPEGARDANDMMMAYFNYFLKNYNGNRAPVVIGHHFFPYRAGAYNEALRKFARVVCSQPEVRCTTFKAFGDYMDHVPSANISPLQKGQFPKAAYQPSLRDMLNSPEMKAPAFNCPN